MAGQPNLETDRLVLRPFRVEDASEVQRLAGDREIAATTLRIPHPYPEGAAEEWIASLAASFASGDSVAFAVTRRSDGALLGAIGLDITRQHERAELGYWIGKPFWGNGYCTEAARAVVNYAFEDVGLNRITAGHFAHNIASGQVMQHIGMTCEGKRIQEIKKWGKFVDVILYGLLRPTKT
jgi:[ribosomal protein S5]-alanine N-acetyltransferase